MCYSHTRLRCCTSNWFVDVNTNVTVRLVACLCFRPTGHYAHCSHNSCLLLAIAMAMAIANVLRSARQRQDKPTLRTTPANQLMLVPCVRRPSSGLEAPSYCFVSGPRDPLSTTCARITYALLLLKTDFHTPFYTRQLSATAAALHALVT